MGAVDPFKVSSSASMTCSENFKFNSKAGNKYRPNIIWYLPLEKSYTWEFHVIISIALSSGKVKSMLTLMLVVILPTCLCHCNTVSFLGLGFYQPSLYNRVTKSTTQ